MEEDAKAAVDNMDGEHFSAMLAARVGVGAADVARRRRAWCCRRHGAVL